MKISEKIARIRLEPEHIRLRYVWGAVAISMFFIIAIWIFSIGTLFKGNKQQAGQEMPNSSDITKQLQTLKEQAPSIKDFNSQALDAANEGVANTNTKDDFQYPAVNNNTPAPQADAYNQLPASTLNQ